MSSANWVYWISACRESESNPAFEKSVLNSSYFLKLLFSWVNLFHVWHFCIYLVYFLWWYSASKYPLGKSVCKLVLHKDSYFFQSFGVFKKKQKHVFLTDKSVQSILITVNSFKFSFINWALHQLHYYFLKNTDVQGDQQNYFCHAKPFNYVAVLSLEVRSVLSCTSQANFSH